MTVTVHEAKTQLSKLIRAVEAGEEVIIARRDKPVVRLEKVIQHSKRRLGFLARDSVKIDGFFDKELDALIENDFYDGLKDQDR